MKGLHMREIEMEGRKIYLAGKERASVCIIEPVGGQDEDMLEQEWQEIRKRCGKAEICYAALRIEDWNAELSPWKAPAVFGNQTFGDGAKETLDFLLQKMLPKVNQLFFLEETDTTYILGGYSLSGLFSLWAGYETDFFHKIAAVSPSVWFPKWDTYIRGKKILARSIYLSLGDKESHTKNEVMEKVSERIELQNQENRKQLGTENCYFEWNQGNHFKEPQIRKAKGFAWLTGEQG